MIDVEAYIVFLTAIFFTVFWFVARANKKHTVVYGILAAVSWMVMSFMWLFLAYEPSATSGNNYDTYAVSLFFGGIATIFVVYTMIDALNIGREDRSLGDVETE